MHKDVYSDHFIENDENVVFAACTVCGETYPLTEVNLNEPLCPNCGGELELPEEFED